MHSCGGKWILCRWAASRGDLQYLSGNVASVQREEWKGLTKACGNSLWTIRPSVEVQSHNRVIDWVTLFLPGGLEVRVHALILFPVVLMLTVPEKESRLFGSQMVPYVYQRLDAGQVVLSPWIEICLNERRACQLESKNKHFNNNSSCAGSYDASVLLLKYQNDKKTEINHDFGYDIISNNIMSYWV